METPICACPKMGVPLNHPFLLWFSIMNHPFWCIPMSGSPHMEMLPQIFRNLRGHDFWVGPAENPDVEWRWLFFGENRWLLVKNLQIFLSFLDAQTQGLRIMNEYERKMQTANQRNLVNPTVITSPCLLFHEKPLGAKKTRKRSSWVYHIGTLNRSSICCDNVGRIPAAKNLS